MPRKIRRVPALKRTSLLAVAGGNDESTGGDFDFQPAEAATPDFSDVAASEPQAPTANDSAAYSDYGQSELSGYQDLASPSATAGAASDFDLQPVDAATPDFSGVEANSFQAATPNESDAFGQYGQSELSGYQDLASPSATAGAASDFDFQPVDAATPDFSGVEANTFQAATPNESDAFGQYGQTELSGYQDLATRSEDATWESGMQGQGAPGENELRDANGSLHRVSASTNGLREETITHPDGRTETTTEWTDEGIKNRIHVGPDGRLTSDYATPGGNSTHSRYVDGQVDVTDSHSVRSTAAGVPLPRGTTRESYDRVQHFDVNGSLIMSDGAGLNQRNRPDCSRVAATNALANVFPDEMGSLAWQRVSTRPVKGGAVLGSDAYSPRENIDGVQALYNGASRVGRTPTNAAEAMSEYGAQSSVVTPLRAIQDFDRGGTAAVLGTPKGLAPNPYNLVGWHAYELRGTYVDPERGERMAILQNPWGMEHPPPVPVSHVPRYFSNGFVGAFGGRRQ